MKSKAFFFSFAFVIATIFLMGLSNVFTPASAHDKNDEFYISVTNQTLEAQKFLEKYPNAQMGVDRDGALAVDYRVDTANPEKYLRLRVFVNYKNNQASGSFIDCYPKMIETNILQYLETEKCLN
ncbi:MAG: hypothetical protein Q7S21_02450 [archaeon]|nr:hypothetical protein [archaeon]